LKLLASSIFKLIPEPAVAASLKHDAAFSCDLADECCSLSVRLCSLISHAASWMAASTVADAVAAVLHSVSAGFEVYTAAVKAIAEALERPLVAAAPLLLRVLRGTC
jgi:hypothetical protein